MVGKTVGEVKAYCPTSCKRHEVDVICPKADQTECSDEVDRGGSRIIRVRCACAGSTVISVLRGDECSGVQNVPRETCRDDIIFGSGSEEVEVDLSDEKTGQRSLKDLRGNWRRHKQGPFPGVIKG